MKTQIIVSYNLRYNSLIYLFEYINLLKYQKLIFHCVQDKSIDFFLKK